MGSVADAALPLPLLLLWSGNRVEPTQRGRSDLCQLSDPTRETSDGTADPAACSPLRRNDAGAVVVSDVVQAEPSRSAEARDPQHRHESNGNAPPQLTRPAMTITPGQSRQSVAPSQTADSGSYRKTPN